MQFYENNKEWIIPLAILVVGKAIDFVLPWIRSYTENRYLSYKDRRIEILLTRYRKIRKLKQNPVFLDETHPAAKFMFLLMLVLALFAFVRHDVMPIFGIYSLIVTELFLKTVVILMVYLAIKLFTSYADTYAVLTFNEYRVKVIKKLINLGATAEEIIQIDNQLPLPRKQ